MQQHSSTLFRIMSDSYQPTHSKASTRGWISMHPIARPSINSERDAVNLAEMNTLAVVHAALCRSVRYSKNTWSHRSAPGRGSVSH